MREIKRKNIRYMTWLSMVMLCFMAVRVFVWGFPATGEELAKSLALIFGALVVTYYGVSVGGDVFNTHSSRKHGGE